LQKGSIFFHTKFKFKNGTEGEKLLVQLNNPKKSEPYLFCKTTSKENGKPLTPGCHHKISLFFIPKEQESLKENTWLQLFEIYPFDAASVIRDSWDKCLVEKGIIKDLTIRQLMNCIKRIPDIETNFKNLILRD
jgi:hypothetical protein